MSRVCKSGGAAVLVGLLAGCGGPFNVGPELSYNMARQFTGEPTNTLNLNFDTTGYDFQIILTGTGFEADVPMNRPTKLVSSITVAYEEEGAYTAGLEVLRPDGISYLKADFQWEYSTKAPAPPIVTPVKPGINSDRMDLIVSGSKDPDTQEILVLGDVAPGEDLWRTIPDTLFLPVDTNEGDGIKNFKVQLRNKYGNLSETADIEVFKKTTPPQNCQVEVTAPSVDEQEVRMWISAENDGPLFFKAIGPGVRSNPYQEFTNTVQTTLDLTRGEGAKEFRVAIRDVAFNFCDFFDFKITYDKNYITKSIEIKDQPLWVAERSQVLVVRYDHLPEDNLEIYVSGEVQETEYTHQWIPWQAEVPIQLKTNSGITIVRTQFRFEGQEEQGLLSAQTFFNPTIGYNPDTNTVGLSRIPTLTTMTITGCSESYEGVSFVNTLPCNAAAGTTITVVYTLEDGETITRSVQVPQ